MVYFGPFLNFIYLFIIFSARFDAARRHHLNMKTKAKLHFKLLKYFIINYDAHSFIIMSFYTAVIYFKNVIQP